MNVKVDTIKEFYPGEIAVINEHEGGIYDLITIDEVGIRIQVISDRIIRIRYRTIWKFEDDFSYCIDPNFELSQVDVKKSETSTYLELATAKLKLRVSKKDAKIEFLTLDDQIINADEKGFHWEKNENYGGDIVQMTKVAQEDEIFLGLGDKPMDTDLRGKRIKNWNSDVYGFHKNQDPLYKSIPFYMGLHHKRAYGIFFDNSYCSYFDFAAERKNACSFWAPGGEMNYYFIYGPELMEVSRQYSKLTGTAELPPLWALGYHQSKWSYYPENKVQGIADQFRKMQIPCDALHIDIDYMDGFRCFTWDREKFPHPANMISELKANGFKTVVIIDPGIKIDKNYSVYLQGRENGYFCQRPDGPLVEGKVWPGLCNFPDFTNPAVRKWWAGLFHELINQDGVRGVWNDMNEPALFEVESKTFPHDVRHDYDGHPCSHRKAHTIYGGQMARATHMGLKEALKEERPFVITRSAHAGSQRYASSWTGDNIANWDHLWIANMQVQRMSISGFSFVGSDVGGFTEQPSPELYTRWVQMAALHPFFRTHSSGDHGDQEPWSFGTKTLDIVRKFIQLRYRLLPYLYTTFFQYSTLGNPMIRPLLFEDQNDLNTGAHTDEFMVGDHLLFCPIQKAKEVGRYMYFPTGKWFNFWTHECIKGKAEHWVDVPLDSSALFVRAGAVLPIYPVQQYVGEKQIDVLNLRVYYSEQAQHSQIYEDDGLSNEHLAGARHTKTFSVQSDGQTMELHQQIDGNFKTSYDRYELEFFGLPFTSIQISLDGSPLNSDAFSIDANGHVRVEVPASFSLIKISEK